jgi:hypothetical protein
MKLWNVYFVGTSNTVTDQPIRASGPQQAKLIAIAMAELNPAILGRLRAIRIA